MLTKSPISEIHKYSYDFILFYYMTHKLIVVREIVVAR